MQATSCRRFPALSSLAFALFALCAGAPLEAQALSSPREGFSLRRGDRIALVGGALAERMQHHGWLETRLQLRHPDLDLAVRNLGFSADELTVSQRTQGFGTRDDYLERCNATVVFAFFGFNESFRGREGLEDYRQDLRQFVEHVREKRYDGSTSPRVVLFTPTPFEDRGDPLLPLGGPENARLAPYAEATLEIARETGAVGVDLFTPLRDTFLGQGLGAAPLTINGVHFTEGGNRVVAEAIEDALFGDLRVHTEERLASLRSLVQEKNLLWFNRYRATDGYNVYGGRSSLKYTDDVSNFTVLQREMEVLDALSRQLDRFIHRTARGQGTGAAPSVETATLAALIGRDEVPPLMPVVTNRRGDGPNGEHVYLSGEKALEKMTAAPGTHVELFADEARFPELANPVQMAFDPAGRLWVAAWPTYPHWQPDRPMNDKLIVFHDDDGDGRADRTTLFADDLHNPTGFEFWNGGVIVAAQPDLLFLEDTDGDLVADRRTRLLHGLSSADTHHAANSFVIGPGGGLYFQEGVFHQSQVETIRGPLRNRDACVWRFDPRTWDVERYVAYGFANPHGHVFDRWGQDFVTDGTGNVNYYALAFSGFLPSPERHRRYFPFFQQRSRPCAGTEILSSPLFPEASQGNYLVANVIGFQGIFQYDVLDDGSGFRAEEVDPLVSSTDPNFRPSDIEVGPDGAVWFLDWHNALIGHMQHHLRDPSRDQVHGRIYRVVPDGRQPLTPEPVAGRPVDELLALLTSDQDRLRYRVRAELSGRDSEAVVRAARTFHASLDAAAPGFEHHRLEALWLQQQHGVLDRALLDEVLTSPDERARAAAVRVVRHMRRALPDAIERFAAGVSDPAPRVRLEALVGLSFFHEEAREEGQEGDAARAAELALEVLKRPMDRFLDYALDETLRALESGWRSALAEGVAFCEDNEAGLAHVLSRLDTDALMSARECAPVFAERLTRHGLGPEEVHAAVSGLARLRGTAAADEWLEAVRRADAREHGHVDHLLSGLFGGLALWPHEALPGILDGLVDLARDGRRASTRRLATVARVEREGSVESALADARRSPAAMIELLDAMPLSSDVDAKEAAFDVARELVVTPPSEPEGSPRVRFVRVELPGERRTLTLAEVQVFEHGVNIAPTGSATQSSTNWSGVAERALDGNTSGNWSDGGQTHTVENRADPFWELDLGGEHSIERVTLFNRGANGPDLAARLDGYVLRALDSERREVARFDGGKAPLESVSHDLLSPQVFLRRAALRTLAELDVRRPEALALLAQRFEDPDMRSGAVSALASVPPADWPAALRQDFATTLTRHLSERAEGDLDGDGGRSLLGLVDGLLPALAEGPTRQALEDARRGLGPKVVWMRPVPDSLLYDRASFSVRAGRRVELVFENTDIMPHNLVVTVPGALAKVGLAAEAMASAPDAWQRAFVPRLDEVLFASKLLQPGQRETLSFDAPTEPGDYPYVCTFPGHWVRMNGVMHVRLDDEAPGESEAPVADAAASAKPSRSYVKNWSPKDVFPHLDRVDEASIENGARVLEEASCLRCHAVTGAPGEELTGPYLKERAKKHTRTTLVTHLLEPSKQILTGYETELFVTTNGLVVSGRVLEEDEEGVSIQSDPYRVAEAEWLALEDIEERRPSTISAMPSGLLSTFELDEILDLLAYLESLKAD